MSETDSKEHESVSTRPSGPSPRPALPRMNGAGRKSSGQKYYQLKSKTHYKETRAYEKNRNSRSDDDETSDSECNSSNNQSRGTSNSEFIKSKSQISQNRRTTEQRAKQKKTVEPSKSSPRTKSVPHKAWEKDINHTIVPCNRLLFILIPTLCCIIAYCYTGEFNNSISKNNITQFEEDIKYVKKKFPMQMPDIWDDYFAGVKTVIEESSKRPAVFLLVANNRNTIDCLSISLGNVTSRSLSGKECLILGPKNFISNSGEIIDWLKPQIEQRRVVVVNDILKVNSEAVGSFHWLCDDTNPLVPRAVYLITMTINRLHVERNNLTKLVEEQIYNTFSNAIHFDILHALVSRITSGEILLIMSEPNVTEGADCP